MLLIEFLLVICSVQVSKKKIQKTAASSAEAMGRKSKMPPLSVAREGKTGKRKPFNP